MALAGAGCDSDGGGTVGSASAPGASGTLSWALDERPRTLDPLHARSPTEMLVARQVYEPLVAKLAGPFERARRAPGLVLSARPSDGARIWSLRLRRAVRFGDGSPFNAQAVLANVERWRLEGAAAALLGDPLADAPRPDLVRFILERPDPGFADRLRSPRLGIVSPRAIAEAEGRPLDAGAAADGGTGAFELREQAPDELVLARNTEWWGTERGLGPGVDQLRFAVVADPAERLAGLLDGAYEIASGLDGPALRRSRRDPLLTVESRAGETLAMERSVRGLAPERVPALSSVWLTTVG